MIGIIAWLLIIAIIGRFVWQLAYRRGTQRPAEQPILIPADNVRLLPVKGRRS